MKEFNRYDLLETMPKGRVTSLLISLRRRGLGHTKMTTIDGGNRFGPTRVLTSIWFFDRNECIRMYIGLIRNMRNNPMVTINNNTIRCWKRSIQDLRAI